MTYEDVVDKHPIAEFIRFYELFLNVEKSIKDGFAWVHIPVILNRGGKSYIYMKELINEQKELVKIIVKERTGLDISALTDRIEKEHEKNLDPVL